MHCTTATVVTKRRKSLTRTEIRRFSCLPKAIYGLELGFLPNKRAWDVSTWRIYYFVTDEVANGTPLYRRYCYILFELLSTFQGGQRFTQCAKNSWNNVKPGKMHAFWKISTILDTSSDLADKKKPCMWPERLKSYRTRLTQWTCSVYS